MFVVRSVRILCQPFKPNVFSTSFILDTYHTDSNIHSHGIVDAIQMFDFASVLQLESVQFGDFCHVEIVQTIAKGADLTIRHEFINYSLETILFAR